MQNVDFYDGRSIRPNQPVYDRVDPEQFSRMSKTLAKEIDKNKKKTSRALFFIIALNIATFTIGLVLGLKLAGGPGKEIVDPQTYKAMTDIGKKVTGIVKDIPEAERVSADQLYPKTEFPFVVRVGADHSSSAAGQAAEFLSKRGHTVILSKTGTKYSIYTGPYKTRETASAAMDSIHNLKSDLTGKNLKIMNR